MGGGGGGGEQVALFPGLYRCSMPEGLARCTTTYKNIVVNPNLQVKHSESHS